MKYKAGYELVESRCCGEAVDDYAIARVGNRGASEDRGATNVRNGGGDTVASTSRCLGRRCY